MARRSRSRDFCPLLEMGAVRDAFAAREGPARCAIVDAIERRVRAIPQCPVHRHPDDARRARSPATDQLVPRHPRGLARDCSRVIAVGHALVTSVRRRRREIALLKTIGFGRRQVERDGRVAGDDARVRRPRGRASRSASSSGASVWRLVADGLGVATVATMPTIALVLTGRRRARARQPHRVLPGRSAARTRPAVALRSE